MKLLLPLRYLPTGLTKKDRAKQVRALSKSRSEYKRGKYYVRPKVASFRNKTSNHILRARRMYGVDKVVPNKELATKTNCSIKALKQIVRKGEGAYYSSGSRPNQTARSWGLARLASSITGGKSSAVDFDILARGCNHRTSKAYHIARPVREGRKHTRRTYI